METRTSEEAGGGDEEGGAHPMRARSSTITMMKDDVKDAFQVLQCVALLFLQTFYGIWNHQPSW